MKALMFFSCFLLMQVMYAQELPLSVMANHLLKSGELSESDAKDENNIVFSKILGNGNVAIFTFKANSPHSFSFILLKNANRYKILNGYDLYTDLDDFDIIFAAFADPDQCANIFKILTLYKNNINIHPAPPKPVFKNGKYTGETKYLPRKIVPTEYFTWRAK